MIGLCLLSVLVLASVLLKGLAGIMEDSSLPASVLKEPLDCSFCMASSSVLTLPVSDPALKGSSCDSFSESFENEVAEGEDNTVGRCGGE